MRLYTVETYVSQVQKWQNDVQVSPNAPREPRGLPSLQPVSQSSFLSYWRATSSGIPGGSSPGGSPGDLGISRDPRKGAQVALIDRLQGWQLSGCSRSVLASPVHRLVASGLTKVCFFCGV